MSGSSNSGGMEFGSVLALIFLVLKLTNLVSWSWWWVLSPIWITLTVYLVFTILLAIVNWSINKRR